MIALVDGDIDFVLRWGYSDCTTKGVQLWLSTKQSLLVEEWKNLFIV